jgi:5-methylcytosine-specific restriction protein B
MTILIDSFAEKCRQLAGTMDYEYAGVSPSIVFSNTGQGAGGKKFFSISLKRLIATLNDIKMHLPSFVGHEHYVEAQWRALFNAHLSDQVVKALAGVQTKPLFSMLGKTIHVANALNTHFSEGSIELNAAYLDVAIAYLESQISDEAEYLEKLYQIENGGNQAAVAEEAVENFGQIVGRNEIYYGAPGTGKSFEIDEITAGSNCIKTVFHPDTQYSDFVGCLKPVMDGDAIQYKFREGPFCKALILAHQNPEAECFLVIEELNRASAAAVFGEIFQLLDRAEDGSSRYVLDLTDPDMQSYLDGKAPGILSDGRLGLPANLSILATMNSSDQAVLPLDTAFKRRWHFKYKPLDFFVVPTGEADIRLGRCSADCKLEGLCASNQSIIVGDGDSGGQVVGSMVLVSA